MEINLSPQLYTLIPDFKIAVIHYHNIEVGSSPQKLKGRLQLFQEAIFFDLEEKNVADISEINEWRTIFKKTGKDPNRYRHSAEALYRRIKKQHYLQSVNSAIDLNNFFSLQYKMPLGIYDLKSVNDKVTIRIGEDGEEYEGLNGRLNHLRDIIVTADKNGPFGSPYIDSKRTSVSDKTKEALQIIYLCPSMQVNDAKELAKSLQKMFLQIHGGTGSLEILSRV